MNVRRLAFAAALLPLAASGPRAAGAGATPALRPCPAAAQQPTGALCGQISVPEDRAIKNGRQIALSLVVLPSRSPAGKSDPVFALAGGPGIGATRLAVSYPRLYDMLQNDHDIVLVDQRGTGDSHPLFCGPPDLSEVPGKALDERLDSKALLECRDRLAKAADLKQYTTSAAAEDLESVRQALGYGKIELLGVSYGTRVGLEYLRRYGPQVRAIALSGVFSPSYRYALNGPAEAQQALKNLYATCAADTPCHEAFPSLAADADAIFAALDKKPAIATLPLAAGQPPLKVTISRSVFARELATLLASREDVTALPLVLHSAAAGDFVPFAGLAIVRHATRNPQADGLALSVICAQDAASLTPAAIAAAAKGGFLRDDRAQFFKRACAIWPRGAADPAAASPVRSDVPALLISGALDPVAPSSYAAEVARTLPKSAHVTVANVAHVPANPCVHGILAAFLKDASTAGLDMACAAKFPPLKFATSMPPPGSGQQETTSHLTNRPTGVTRASGAKKVP
jgi:pimeloyl-ACP methyl ester carboxylesterase